MSHINVQVYYCKGRDYHRKCYVFHGIYFGFDTFIQNFVTQEFGYWSGSKMSVCLLFKSITRNCGVFFFMKIIDKPTWLKSKGYLHITAQIDVDKNAEIIFSKIKNPDFINKYAFYPLIHSNINERRYKRIASDYTYRAHSCKDESGKHVKHNKIRPLHYATHFDALIFGYYAEILQKRYEERILMFEGLNNCIIAYRKLQSEVEGKNKSTIDFANEIFEEIRNKTNSSEEDSVVLTFDIKSFFSSLNHDSLKSSWADILGVERLPQDHYNVFKAATQFSYIFLDELRTSSNNKLRKGGFNEKELARIRNQHGINALFDSPKAFREQVKNGSIKLHKFPFRDKETKQPIGIPQGLPISATLANLYLLKFDLKILDVAVKDLNAYYRRYSDDIVIVCSSKVADVIETLVKDEMKKHKVEISINKTEKFLFKKLIFGNKEPRLTSIKILKSRAHINAPFNYLGFEFNGQKVLIKSANVAKFYRRMISSIKSKAKRAKLLAEKNPGTSPIIFRRQLYKLYTTRPLNNVKIRNRWKKIVKTDNGNFRLQTGLRQKVLRSNYLTYVRRASEIMNEPGIERQIRNHKKIFNQAIYKYLNKK